MGSKLEDLRTRLEELDRKHAEFLAQLRRRLIDIHELQAVILTANADEKGIRGVRYSSVQSKGFNPAGGNGITSGDIPD